MMFYVKAFIVSILILIALDAVWLGFVMRDFNNRELAAVARMEDGSIHPRKLPAILTYVLMAVSLAAFAAPSVVGGSYWPAAGKGVLLGFCVYAIFDLTNLSIIKDYPWAFAAADIGWGSALYGIATSILFQIRGWLG